LRPKKILYLLLLILIAFLLILKKTSCFRNEKHDYEPFRDTSHLIPTKHAYCRMDCRHITKEEIKEILEKGKVNYSKSDLSSKGHSTYALEGYSHENQHIRVVVAPESDGLVVITCIDLDKEWPCNCY
jgi:hypothetical protein